MITKLVKKAKITTDVKKTMIKNATILTLLYAGALFGVNMCDGGLVIDQLNNTSKMNTIMFCVYIVGLLLIGSDVFLASDVDC